jgi:hypothetical protein
MPLWNENLKLLLNSRNLAWHESCFRALAELQPNMPGQLPGLCLNPFLKKQLLMMID